MNMNDIWNSLQKVRSIKDAGEKALLELEKRDAPTARLLCGMIYGKQSPEAAIKKFAQSGKLSKANLNKLHTGYNMLKKVGLKVNIPDNVWSEVEQLLNDPKDLVTPKIKGF